MQKRLAQVFAVLVGMLALVGLFVDGRHLLDLMNVDIALDILRIGLFAFLAYAAFFTDNAATIKNALMTFAGLYLGLAVLGLFNSTLWGLLPTGLTGFDVMFHLAAGLIGLVAAMRIHENRHTTISV